MARRAAGRPSGSGSYSAPRGDSAAAAGRRDSRTGPGRVRQGEVEQRPSRPRARRDRQRKRIRLERRRKTREGSGAMAGSLWMDYRVRIVNYSVDRQRQSSITSCRFTFRSTSCCATPLKNVTSGGAGSLTNPAAIEAPVQPGGRIPDRRQADRPHLPRRAATPAAAARPPLSDRHRAHRQQRGAALRLRRIGPARARAVSPRARRRRGGRGPQFEVRDRQWPMTPRKLLFHILFHELRHWAQVALAVRLAGFEPPGDHDFVLQPRAEMSSFQSRAS